MGHLENFLIGSWFLRNENNPWVLILLFLLYKNLGQIGNFVICFLGLFCLCIGIALLQTPGNLNISAVQIMNVNIYRQHPPNRKLLPWRHPATAICAWWLWICILNEFSWKRYRPKVIIYFLCTYSHILVTCIDRMVLKGVVGIAIILVCTYLLSRGFLLPLVVKLSMWSNA